MRLCYIAAPHSIHTQRWLRYFVRQEHEVHLVSPSSENALVPQGVIWHKIAMPTNIPKVRTLALGYKVRQQVHKIQPDLLHAHQASPYGWWGAMASYHPYIITAWGSDLLVRPRQSWFYRLLARWTLSQADYVTCVSKNLADAARTLGVTPSRLEVAPWGVDTTIFRPAGSNAALRAQLGLGGEPIVLSLRPIKPLYNPLDIAQAIPLVLEKVPQARFVIRTYMCDPDMLAQFKAIVRKHGVTEAVRYAGDLPDDNAIADLYRIADVAVSVPSSDGMPLSVMEALACGAALVLSDVPSLHEWVRHQQEGLYVPVGDIRALSAAIIRLLTDEALRRQLQTNGLTLIQQHADSRVWMARAEELYTRLVSEKK